MFGLNLIVSSSGDKTIRIWDIGSEMCVMKYEYENMIHQIRYLPSVMQNCILIGTDSKIEILYINRNNIKKF